MHLAPAVMAAGDSLYEGYKARSEVFSGLYDGLKDHLYFECLDDSGNSQGYAIAKLIKKFRHDDDGGFVEIAYIQVSDGYYQHWLETSHGQDQFHHLCRHSLRSCQRKVGREGVVHIQRWRAVTAGEVSSVVQGWKTKPLLDLGKPKLPGRREEWVEEPVQTQPKSKPATRAPKAGVQEVSLDTDFDSDSPNLVPVKAGRRQEKEGEKSKRRKRTEKSPSDDSRGDCSRKPKDRRKESKSRKAPTALDAILTDEVEPRGKLGIVEQDLDSLRATLGEDRRKNDSKKDAGAVLALRVQESERKKKKEKKRDRQDKVAAALRKITSKKKQDFSEDSSSSEDESEGDDTVFRRGDAGELASRQRRLKKIALEKPGALLLRGYGLMHEQLGTMFGEARAGEEGIERTLQPAAVRYLLTAAMPLIDRKTLGEQR